MNTDLDPKDPISKVTTVVTSDLVTTTPISNVTTVVTSPGISSASSLSDTTVNFTPTAPLLLTASAKKDNPLSPASKKKNKNDADKKRAQKQRSFARTFTIEDVLLSSDKKTLVSVKGVKMAQIARVHLKEFCKNLGVTSYTSMNMSDMKLSIVNKYNLRGELDMMKTGAQVKKGKVKKGIKPVAVKLNGTIYRIINVFLHDSMRAHYIAAHQPKDKHDLDCRESHDSNWSTMHDMYMDKDGKYDFLDTIGIKSMHGFTKYFKDVSDCISSEYDEITMADFRQCVSFINRQYGQAKRKNETSGCHDDFWSYVGTKDWILYYHERMMLMNDTNYSNIAFAKLGLKVAKSSESLSAAVLKEQEGSTAAQSKVKK